MDRAAWRLALPAAAHAEEGSALRDVVRDGDRLYLTGHRILHATHAYVVAVDLAGPRDALYLLDADEMARVSD